MASQHQPDQSTAELVAGFTAGFAQRTLTEHGVVSGLGVWLLLALLAPDAPGPARNVLEQVLGTEAEDAAVADQPHRRQQGPSLDHWTGVPVFSAWVAHPR